MPTNPRGLIFTGELVPGVMDGSIMVTTRIIKPQPAETGFLPSRMCQCDDCGNRYRKAPKKCKCGCTLFKSLYEHVDNAPCPFRAGEKRYVKEAWCWPGEEFLLYRANPSDCEFMNHAANRHAENHNYPKLRWCPANTMPIQAARTWVEILSVKSARCQEITVGEAVDSGCWPAGKTVGTPEQVQAAYAALWDRLNAKHGFPWSANCWVWRVSFRRV